MSGLMLQSTAIRAMVLADLVFGFQMSHQVCSGPCPAARPFELVYTMTLQQEIKHTWCKIMVSAILQDDIYIRAFRSAGKCMLRHGTPPLSTAILHI
jgi:hypothetical protein